MAKAFLIAASALILSGCKDVVVEDHGPDRMERETAMRNCVGSHDIRGADFDVRLSCTQAVYGRYTDD